MRIRISSVSSKWLRLIGAVVLVAVAVMFRGTWWPRVNEWADRVLVATGARQAEEDEVLSAGASGQVTHLELSEKALGNLGLTADYIRPVELQTFRRSIIMPATIVERPGKTRIQVAAPMTGVVTFMHAVQGAAIEPGSLLFQIRLTHEDLVQAQTDFVTTLGELDVELREIERLQEVTRSGAVAGIRVLESEYKRDRLQALLNARREALRLHGLSSEQVEQIAEERKLLSELQVFAPSANGAPPQEFRLTGPAIQRTSYEFEASDEEPAALILQQLLVHRGEAVTTGQALCFLADYSELYIEGLAFEQDSTALSLAAEKDWRVDAVFEEPGSQFRVVEDLEIAYLASEVDAEARTLRVYADLPNHVVRDETDADGNRFLTWAYRPGRRLQLRVPVEEWANQIVLPVDAVAKEGAEFFVFQQNGRYFERVPVHVTYRDQFSVVIANDGALFAGTYVAMRAAHQMQMALKNMSGGAVDPHAGHNH